RTCDETSMRSQRRVIVPAVDLVLAGDLYSRADTSFPRVDEKRREPRFRHVSPITRKQTRVVSWRGEVADAGRDQRTRIEPAGPVVQSTMVCGGCGRRDPRGSCGTAGLFGDAAQPDAQ